MADLFNIQVDLVDLIEEGNRQARKLKLDLEVLRNRQQSKKYRDKRRYRMILNRIEKVIVGLPK